MKGFQASKRQFMNCYVLSGIDTSPRKIQLVNLRCYLSTDMVDQLRFAMATEDDIDMTIKEILKKYKGMLEINAKRNIGQGEIRTENTNGRRRLPCLFRSYPDDRPKS